MESSAPRPNMPSAPVPAIQRKTSTMRNVGWTLFVILGLVVALGISFAKALADAGGIPSNPERLGELIGATLGPLILSCIGVGVYYAFRKSRRTPRRMIIAIVIWTIILSIASILGSTAIPVVK